MYRIMELVEHSHGTFIEWMCSELDYGIKGDGEKMVEKVWLWERLINLFDLPKEVEGDDYLPTKTPFV